MYVLLYPLDPELAGAYTHKNYSEERKLKSLLSYCEFALLLLFLLAVC